MSKQDYSVIQRTKLSDFSKLPNDLQNRYLATCPRAVRFALLKLAK